MKKIFTIFIFSFVLVLNSFSAKIDDDLNEVLTGSNYLIEDFKTISGFLTSEIGNLIGFTSTAGNNTPANVCAFPGISFGGNVGVTVAQFNINGFKSLSLDYIPVEELAEKMPPNLGIFVINPYLKTGLFGLPFLKADIGIKYLPLQFNIKATDTSLDYKNYLFGFDLRTQFLEDSLLSPLGLLAIISLDFISGHFIFTNTQQSTERVNVNSTDYDLMISGTNKWTIDWNMRSIGLKLIANKSIAFFSPFIGTGINLNTGVLNGNIGMDAEVTLKEIPPLTGSATGKSGVIGTVSKEPDSMDFRLIAGFELGFFPYVKFNIVYEWGGEIYSLNGGLKIQIP